MRRKEKKGGSEGGISDSANLLWFMRGKKKNKKSNQKTKTSFEREKEKGQRSGAEVGEDKEKIM